jgi:hypothetical protein
MNILSEWKRLGKIKAKANALPNKPNVAFQTSRTVSLPAFNSLFATRQDGERQRDTHKCTKFSPFTHVMIYLI